MIDKQTKIINLDYIDPFYYKLFIIKNIDFFKSYINKNMLKKQVCNSLFYNLIKKKIYQLTFLVQNLTRNY
jgi:hypothetical protein